MNRDEFISASVDRAGIGSASNGGRVHGRGRWRRCRITEAEDQTGRGSQIVLAIVATIGEPGQEIFELKQTEGDVTADAQIETSASHSSEGVLMERIGKESCVADDAGSRRDSRATDENVDEGGHASAMDVEARTEQVVPHATRDVADIVKVIATDVGYKSQP